MTSDQEKQLLEIGQKIHSIFHGEYGNVTFRFNLNPNRKEVNLNIATEFSKKLNPNK